MKPRCEYNIGIGASTILLILVVIALAALSLTSLGSARNNAALSDRNLEMTLAYYTAAAQAQRTLAAMDAVIAEYADTFTNVDALKTLFAFHGLSNVKVYSNYTFTFFVNAGAQRLLEVGGTLSPGQAPRYTLTRHTLGNGGDTTTANDAVTPAFAMPPYD